jgi:hypothetical protein
MTFTVAWEIHDIRDVGSNESTQVTTLWTLSGRLYWIILGISVGANWDLTCSFPTLLPLPWELSWIPCVTYNPQPKVLIDL